jgi:hypothetical protein
LSGTGKTIRGEKCDTEIFPRDNDKDLEPGEQISKMAGYRNISL